MAGKFQHRTWVLIAVLLATFLSAMEGTIVSTAMPSITEDLQGLAYVNMTFSIYLLVAAITTPIYGKLADMYGRKRVLMAAVLVFLIGSALCGLAQSMGQLILFRAVQALGAGAVLPLTSTIIGDMYTTEERTRMQALFSGVWAVSGVSGPLIGGFIVETIDWRWIFFINLPFGLLSLFILFVAFREERVRRERMPIDWSGALLFLLSISSLLYVLLFSVEEGASPLNVGLVALCLASFALFLRVERHAADPFFPMTIWKNRFIIVPNLYVFFAFAFIIATTVYIPMWVQQIHHGTPTQSGFALTFMTFGWPLGAILNARLIGRFGPWKVPVFGACLLVACSAVMAMIQPGFPLYLFFVVMFFAGLSFGLTTTVLTIILQNAVEWEQRGVAMGSNALFSTMGQTIFIAVFGAVFNAATNHAASVETMPHGIRIVFYCVLAVSAISCVVAFKLPKMTKEELFRDSVPQPQPAGH